MLSEFFGGHTHYFFKQLPASVPGSVIGGFEGGNTQNNSHTSKEL
jgi:hypothetical protein